MLSLGSAKGARCQRYSSLLNLAFFLLLLAPTQKEWAEEARTESFSLAPGRSLESEIDGDTKHFYRVALEEGDDWLIGVEQLGIDVRLSLITPTNTQILTVNNPLGRNGLESLIISAETRGDYRIQVEPADRYSPSGLYRIEALPLLAKSPGDASRLAAEKAMSEAARLSNVATASARKESILTYQEARRHWQILGDRRREAEALLSIAVLKSRLGDAQEAASLYREVLPMWQEEGDRRMEALVLNDLGLAQRDLGEISVAADLFERSASLQQKVGNHYGEAIAHNNICLTFESRGDLVEALECFQRVLALKRQANEKSSEALTLNSIGGMQFMLGEPESAMQAVRDALQIVLEVGDRRGQAWILNSLAYFHRNLGESQEAIEYYRQSAEIFEELGDIRWIARTLNNIGYAYLRLGDAKRATDYLLESLDLRRQTGDKRGEGITLTNLGTAFFNLGRLDQALTFHRQALDCLEKVGDERTRGLVLAQIGRSYLSLGNFPEALAFSQQALAAAQKVADVNGEANAWLQKGLVELAQGEPQRALTSLELARPRFQAAGNRAGVAQSLTASANALARLGKRRIALEEVNEALAIVESLRTEVDSPYLRATFLASTSEAYDLLIDLLMGLDRKEPGQEFAAMAFQASERSRARSLLDLIGQQDVLAGQGVDGEFVTRRHRLRRDLHAKAGLRHRLVKRPHTPEEVDDLQGQIEKILSELELVDAKIRRQSPSYAALSSTEPVTAEEIQQLLDDDTLLLEYSLSPRRSYLWAIDRHSIASYELPPETEIDRLVRHVYRQWSSPGEPAASNSQTELATLSRMLLEPLVTRLDQQRLVIIPDGSLHYLPFGALLQPRVSLSNRPASYISAPPVILQHEVTYLSSASVLAASRKTHRPSSPQPTSIAILADPVFDRTDQRVRDSRRSASEDLVSSTALARAETGRRSSNFERLPSTRKEAEAIASLLPAEQVQVFSGFDASRSIFFDHTLRDYQIIHLATHGFLDTQNPDLSALVLSLVNEEGMPQQGYLRFHDLFGLDLRAELVVLSGCETALGREIRGEGLFGLTRGFMYAGVPRVIASLWQVDDSTTSDLMANFYKAIISRGLRPAAALRMAQIELLKKGRKQAPAEWAAFTFQGDWQ